MSDLQMEMVMELEGDPGVDVVVVRQSDGILYAEEVSRVSESEIIIHKSSLQLEADRNCNCAGAWIALHATDEVSDSNHNHDLLMELFLQGFQAGLKHKE